MMKLLDSKSSSKMDNSYNNLFPEFAYTLFFFIERLHKTLVNNEIKQVYFLAREGQPLKHMFDLYQKKVGSNLSSRYLKVSRRSTLLPSLKALEEETFNTLFRQYRQISLFEFLSSLGLGEHAVNITDTLKLPEGAEHQREEDFSKSKTFNALKQTDVFQHVFESERIRRRDAFISYLEQLSGGTMPQNLCLVDVGWKGTIQDNLFSMLCVNNRTSVNSVTGYYIGLISPGSAYNNNKKHGLVFSSTSSVSPKFHIFNENRALFEIILAADHGSIVNYEITSGGCAKAISGSFEEREMLEREVFPIQKHLFENFKDLLKKIHKSHNIQLMPFRTIVQSHGRMVFKPTTRERTWFSSVFHVENYGVFQLSKFSNEKGKAGLKQRLHFFMLLLKKRNTGSLGFWPWKTIYEQGGSIPAAIYAAIRHLQR